MRQKVFFSFLYKYFIMYSNMVHMDLLISNCMQHYISFVVNILNKKSQWKHQFLEHFNDMASPTQSSIALNVVNTQKVNA